MRHPQPLEIDGKLSTMDFFAILTPKRKYKCEVLLLFLPCWQSPGIHLARS